MPWLNKMMLYNISFPKALPQRGPLLKFQKSHNDWEIPALNRSFKELTWIVQYFGADSISDQQLN